MSSTKLTKDTLRRAILKEFKMLGMGSPAPMQMKSLAHSSMDHSGMDHGGMEMEVHSMGQGSVSRESCCEAVMCMVECCSCPVTKAALIECCQALMSGEYDQ